MYFFLCVLAGALVGVVFAIAGSGWLGIVLIGLIVTAIGASFCDWSGDGDGRQRWHDE